MEAETVSTRTQVGFVQRMGPALVPVLLIAVGYIDPGKWVAAIEGGARFGFDLVAIMLIFNLAAVLCQYVAARISVASGRNLAQICNDEYDKWTCMFLGVQAEFSAILVDLTMVLGVAHGLHLLFGVDLATGVFLAAIDAFVFPIFASIVDHRVANTVSICLAGLVLFFYVSGLLLSQPEMQFSMNGMLTRLNGESAFAIMSLLGANIMPHNFYLHSYFALESRSLADVSKTSLCQDHFFAIFCVFSGLSLVNYVLMNAAANVFNSTGLVLLTFQDAISLMEQVFRSPVVPLAFLVLLFFSNQLTALAWTFGGEVVLHDFLKVEIPGWLHRATIRILAVAPALYCVWTSGAEGIYQLLTLTQVLVAMMLPSSVIPLFRVASSRQIMGVHKIPQIAEFLALTTFMGMLGLNIIFVVEMIFGSSDWAGGLRWSSAMGTSVPYITLLISSCASLCLMLWLAATPLRSASNRLEAQVWNLDIQNDLSYSSVEEQETERRELRQQEEETLSLLRKSPKFQPDRSSASTCYDLPETILMSKEEIRSSPVEEYESSVKFPAPRVSPREESEVKERPVSQSTMIHEATDDYLAAETKTLKIELTSPVENTVGVENNKHIVKDVDEGDTWEPEETPKAASVGNLSALSDGPPSFRSLSGKSDEGGSGTGSLSRLAGLGRAARRHLSVILDEFWGQLYGFHGQAVAEAKAKKLDQLLVVDQKAAPSAKSDPFGKYISGHHESCSGRGSDSHMNSGLYDSLKQQRVPGSIDSLSGQQRGVSSLLASRMQLLHAYANANRNACDLGERRYHSLRAPASSEGWDYQPATVHGYQLASHLNRLAKERSLGAMHFPGEVLTSRPPSLGAMSYSEQLALALRQKSPNGISPGPAPGFQNLAASRNIALQPERSHLDVPSSVSADNLAMAVNEKKYCSMPDISGLSIANRALHTSNKIGYWDGSTGGYGGLYGRVSNEPLSYPNSGSSLGGTPLVFDELSPSRGYKGAFDLAQRSAADTGSLWSRQPFEQFGLAEKNGAPGGEEQPGTRSNPMYMDTTSTVDSEAKLLQSFRHCILKLLKLEGSDWLFRQGDGVDEELIDRVAAREKFIYEAEAREISQVGHMGEPLVSSVPNCGDGCIWRADLIVSFGVWCIHRILSLSLMESRPELWGKYTYVLNRLQGVIDLAFSKPRTPMSPCFCLQIPASHQPQRASPPSVSNGTLPPPAAKPTRGKLTTAATLLELIRDVETAISCRKGRSGTAAGDVAFPEGKKNLASVLKRYKRRLSNKPVGMNQEGPGSRKNVTAAMYGS